MVVVVGVGQSPLGWSGEEVEARLGEAAGPFRGAANHKSQLGQVSLSLCYFLLITSGFLLIKTHSLVIKNKLASPHLFPPQNQPEIMTSHFRHHHPPPVASTTRKENCYTYFPHTEMGSLTN